MLTPPVSSAHPLAWAERHVQAFLGPHSDRYLPLDGASRCKVELVALGYHREKQRSLHECKVVTDALVLACPEGHVGRAMVRSSPLRRETLGLEACRILPEFRVTVNIVDADQNP